MPRLCSLKGSVIRKIIIRGSFKFSSTYKFSKTEYGRENRGGYQADTKNFQAICILLALFKTIASNMTVSETRSEQNVYDKIDCGAIWPWDVMTKER